MGKWSKSRKKGFSCLWRLFLSFLVDRVTLAVYRGGYSMLVPKRMCLRKVAKHSDPSVSSTYVTKPCSVRKKNYRRSIFELEVSWKLLDFIQAVTFYSQTESRENGYAETCLNISYRQCCLIKIHWISISHAIHENSVWKERFKNKIYYSIARLKGLGQGVEYGMAWMKNRVAWESACFEWKWSIVVSRVLYC